MKRMTSASNTEISNGKYIGNVISYESDMFMDNMQIRRSLMSGLIKERELHFHLMVMTLSSEA